MVTSVYRPHRPRMGIEGARPVKARWEEAAARLRREVPQGHPAHDVLLGMQDEHAIDRIDDAIAAYQQEKYAAAMAERPWWLTRREDEIRNLSQRYETARVVGIAKRRVIRRMAEQTLKVVEFLGMLPRDWNAEFEIFDLSKPFPRFPTVEETDGYIRQLLASVMRIETMNVALDAVVAFDSAPLSERAWTTVCGIVNKLEQSKASPQSKGH